MHGVVHVCVNGERVTRVPMPRWAHAYKFISAPFGPFSASAQCTNILEAYMAGAAGRGVATGQTWDADGDVMRRGPHMSRPSFNALPPFDLRVDIPARKGRGREGRDHH